MNRRILPFALGAAAAMLLFGHARALLDYRGSVSLDLQMDRWADREITMEIERGLGTWLHQLPDDALKIHFADDPGATREAKMSLGSKSVAVPLAVTPEMLRPAVSTLTSRVGLPRRVHVISMDVPSDRVFVDSVRILAQEYGWDLNEIRVERSSPMPPSRNGDWLFIAKVNSGGRLNNRPNTHIIILWQAVAPYLKRNTLWAYIFQWHPHSRLILQSISGFSFTNYGNRGHPGAGSTCSPNLNFQPPGSGG